MTSTPSTDYSRGVKKLLALFGAALVSFAVLTGCTGSDSSSSGPVGDPGMAQDGSARSSTVEQDIIKTADVTLLVDDVNGSVDRIASAATAANGVVDSRNVYNTGEATEATLTVRVPSAQLDRFLDEITTFGDVESLNVGATDVSLTVTDLEARIEAINASIDRLEELQSQANNVSDLVAIETELTNRLAERDSLVAQRDYLADQVDLSTVTIYVTPNFAGQQFAPPGFVDGVRYGWDALVTVTGVTITVAGFLLPFLIPIVVIAVVVIGIIVLRRRSR